MKAHVVAFIQSSRRNRRGGERGRERKEGKERREGTERGRRVTDNRSAIFKSQNELAYYGGFKPYYYVLSVTGMGRCW